NNIFYIIGNKDLFRVKFNTVFLQRLSWIKFWKVENTLKSKRMVYIEMQPEKWFLIIRKELTVELFIVFVFKSSRVFSPKRCCVVDLFFVFFFVFLIN